MSEPYTDRIPNTCRNTAGRTRSPHREERVSGTYPLLLSELRAAKRALGAATACVLVTENNRDFSRSRRFISFEYGLSATLRPSQIGSHLALPFTFGAQG